MIVARCLSLLWLLAGAALLASSWLDARFFPAAWLGLTILFWLSAKGSPWQAAAVGFLLGAVSLVISFVWAPDMLAITLASEEGDWLPSAVFAALTIWESMPYGCLAVATYFAHKRQISAWMVAAIWVSFEWGWPRVFPWSLAHTQTEFKTFIQLAELGGTHLLSFLMVIGCLGAALALHERRIDKLRMGIALACLGGTFLFGLWKISGTDSKYAPRSIRVGVVQVDPSHVDSTRRMRNAVEKLGSPLDLVVWPESTLGTYSSSIGGLPEIKRSLKIVREPFIDQTPAMGLGTWLLAGGKSFESNSIREDHYFQTAFLVNPEGQFAARYHKRALMPIGEYMPGEESYPWLHEWAQLSEYVERGDSDDPVKIGDDSLVGVLICYEEVVPELSRRTVAAGAGLLVSLINASAFDDCRALDQHLRLAMLRAVENRRWLVRCAGTGISCCVTPTGDVVNKLPPNIDSQFAADVPLLAGRTLFNRAGYLFPNGCIVVVAVGLLAKLTARQG